MFSEEFSNQKGCSFIITAEQASDFAKTVCNDFNPIHNPGNKRFCIPGDLLFALAVENYGLSEEIDVVFTGLVGADTQLTFPVISSIEKVIKDARGRQYLTFNKSGKERSFDKNVEELIRAYVAFSGQNFPSILVPLMADFDVMINPSRPLIIYQSMSLRLKNLEFSKPSLLLSKRELNVSGKRGDAYLYFNVLDGIKSIGQGVKHLILSGLRPFDKVKVEEMINQYCQLQREYKEL